VLLPGPVGPGRSPSADFPGPGEHECIDGGICSDDQLPADVVPPPEQEPEVAASDSSALVIAALAGLAIVVAGLGVLAYLLRRVPSTEPELTYRGVARLAARLGYGPRPAQTAYEFASRLGQLVPVAEADLRLIATAKVEATYGRREPGEGVRKSLGDAYRRVRLGLLRLLMRRPRVGLRPRSTRTPRD
jgi:hypothetical protein